jgi:hypothetical protein
MSNTKVHLRTHPQLHYGHERTVMLSDSVIKRWKIPTGQPVILRFGSAKHAVRVIPVSSSRNELRIGASLAYQLGLAPHGANLRLAYRPASRTLRIGPLVGVMLPRIMNVPGRRFGIITPFCRELTDACRAEGVFVYFFTPNELRSTNDKVEGWTLAGQEYKSSFPIPDVIYNRLPSRKLDALPELQRFLGRAKTVHGTRVFNEKYLDKTEVFSALRRYKPALRYLPESHSYTGTAQLRRMCARYRSVFLKPITGSLGKGIIRITRKPSGGYVVDVSSVGTTARQSYATLDALIQGLAGKLRVNKYQIQRGLELIRVGNRPVDFRALTQKDKNGKWHVTSVVARIAGNERFVSNVAQGGTIGPVRQTVAKSNLAAGRSGVLERLKRAAATIAQGIEACIPAHFGELGIDLAVDRSTGRVWLLEVNSKPAKNDSGLLNEAQGIRPSVRLLVQYFRYLSNL